MDRLISGKADDGCVVAGVPEQALVKVSRFSRGTSHLFHLCLPPGCHHDA